MNEILAQKMVEAVETAGKLADSGAQLVMEEFLNYMLFVSLWGVLQNLLWGVLGLILYKGLKAMVASLGDVKGSQLLAKDILNTVKNMVLPLSIIVPVMLSAASIKTVARIIIAPHMYAAEEGIKLLKDIKK